ncbi:hypothetical protein KSP40_PGU010141 [Platanthera guangdongensis]|uniref:VWFA domain-containing protein n=1 Tax=Platanthera guangdongensis TaxID=2320717 RepID=A0ABR2LLI7_9ASPA
MEIHIDEKTQLDFIISINTDLRRLATEGVSMAKYIATKDNHSDAQCVPQLEEIYQMIFSRFEEERRRLESTSRSTQNYIDPSAGRSRSACFDSWLSVLLLLNRRSLNLDINLLLKLSNTILVDAVKACKALPSFHVLIQQALDYSLNYSSRSPVEFSPHQTFLWIFDAGISVDSAHLQFSSLILEMWFRWHSSLWNCFSERVKTYTWIRNSVYELFPTRIQILGIILNQGSFPIKDYDVNCLKHRVTSRALWQDGPLQDSLMDVLLSSADCLFKQILFVHEKYFKRDVFEKLKSILSELTDPDATLEGIQTLRSLILSSSHSLFSSLMGSVIQPLLEELYAGYSLNDSISLGKAWVHIGILRFHLLLYPDGSDPAVKNALKSSWIHRRISLLELEMKVRRDCELLSGKCTDDLDEWSRESQEKLEMEEKCANAKIVFRPQPSKYNELKLACSNFLPRVHSCTSLLKNARCNNEIDIVEMANDWQVTSQSFITRLSEDFTEYMDLVQPIQVAVYEMKLGLSLFISGINEREYMSKTGIDKIDNILDPICLLMQFPKALRLNHSSLITLKNFAGPKMKPCENRGSERVQILDINLLNSLIAISSKISTVRDISHLQQQSIICHITFLHVAHTICSSQVMDKGSFLLLNEVFRRFSNFWIAMKSKAKESEETEAQYFKFRPRSFILNDFVDVEEAYLGNPESGGNHSSEGQELLLEREFLKLKETSKEVDDMEQDWNLIPESILSSLVHTHNQLFGSGNLVKPPGVCFITDQERLLSFMDSYKLGTTIIEGLQALSSSITDDNLLPEHLIRVCIDFKLSSGSKICNLYNVYKDSNTEVIFRMVEPLTVIQNMVKSFLEEWPDHPGLMKVIEITETLLEIPPCTPLSKALLGLQLLIGKIQFLQENDSRFRLKDEIQPLYGIISSWQKLEVDSWTTLLDGVSKQHEVNAAKLWFPLYGVLHRSLSPSSSGYNESDKILTMRSIEEFICTSSVGEFKKRLQLLLAFHGQLKDGIHLQAYFSPDSKESLHVEENLKILYNSFGYYIQFLPRVLKRIEAGKGSIEKDLKEYSRLFSWEHPCTHSLESSRKTRQKICKLVQKFNDVLQEPVMAVLAEEAKLIREEDPAWLKEMSDKNDSLELRFPIDLGKLGVTERFVWFGDWKRKTNTILRNVNDGSSGVSFASECLDKNFKTSWDAGWKAIETICKNAASFSHIWKQETRNLRQRRSLTELLKILEECGLSRHKLVDFEDLKSGQPSSSFLQPSFKSGHLLLQEGSSSSTDTTSNLANKFEENADIRCSMTWAVANQFYFKSLSMIHQLHECQKCFSKDLTLEQVNQVISYIHHLVVVQRDQRSIAYGVSSQIEKLRKLCHLLSSIEAGTHCPLSPHQSLIVKHIWQQKDLFDSLLALLKDMHIFLVTVKRSHMDACDTFRDEADNLSVIVDKFVPVFMQSKNKLDRYLLGSNGVVSTLNPNMPCIVSVEMENLVRENFHTINTLEESVNALSIQKVSSESIKDSLLSRIRKIISEANKENVAFNSEVEAHNQSMCDDHSFNKQNDVFGEAYECTNKAIVGVFGNIDSSCVDHCGGGVLSAKDITSWKKIFESYMENLHLDRIYDGLLQTITEAFNLVECAGIQYPDLCSKVGIQLKHLYLSLEHLLKFSEAVLFEFLDAHRTIAEMTNALAQIFILLLSKGFGSTEDQTEKTAQGTQDSCGTGMGEGQGLNDVSDEIEDEAQLTGPAEKDVPDNSYIPSDKNKGIEMDEDFPADAFSVSEGSDDGDDGEDVDIESKMGETGDRNQIVDEKLWDKEKDTKLENSMEKYESGPSVEEMDSSCRELRAKEDDAPTLEESDKFNKNEPDGQTEEQKDASDDENNADDRMLDKDTAFEDPTGIQTTEQEMYQEDDDMDEAQGSDTVEDGDSGPAESDKEIVDDLPNPTDYVSDEISALSEEKHDTSNNLENKDNKNVEQEPSKDVTESGKSESVEHSQDKEDIFKQSQTPFSVDSSLEPQMCWSDSTNTNNGVASSSVLKDEDLNMQFLMPNSSDDSKLAPNQPQPHISQGDTQARHLKETNPYRSIGKAIEMWKEKVSVLDDADEEEPTNPDYMEEDESAVEYRYVSEGEKSTSQALGPATADQIKTNADGSEGHDIEDGERRKEHNDGMKEVQEHPEPKSLQSMNALISYHKHVVESLEIATVSDAEFEALPQNYTEYFLGNVVSFRSLDISNKTASLDSGVIDMDLSTSIDNEIISGTMNQKAIADWKRYELATTRLSHELAEQLRLIMEPALASRLQGDYKTGKRINMKKVIPYIASQFRRDKIWLRRTKPNKRDYQVVIAIDDSRSMSESNCGNLAIEALVTVCRAMSHVEVGQFAVSSFGGKGNIKLLHDFDQSFSGEAGVKIISNLSFKQDNTIVDEPVADLLKHLKGMLDSVMGNARAHFGKNPLHQLTLIISDGRLNEKENLRRCVRNLLNTKRMIAFILLDSHEESIMDQMEAFVDGRTTTFKKYIDGFPFPYYIVLKNVEALPRTLADLLRQWFELMQSTGE